MKISGLLTVIFCVLIMVYGAGCGSKSNLLASSLAGVTVVAASQQTTITWTKGATSKATAFNLYWSNVSGVTKSSGKKIANVTSPYVHTGLTNGLTYYYVITEITDGAEGGESPEASATPKEDASSLTNISATALNQQTTISWTKGSSSKATAFNIYWSSIPGVTKSSGLKIANATSPYIHSGLTNGVTYYYVITELANAIEGLESQEVSATPKADISSLTGLSITSANQQTTVSWAKGSSSKATAFNLYWSTSPTVSQATGQRIANVTSPYTHTGLTNGVTYYYVITEVTTGYEGLDGPLLAAEPKADVPEALSGITIYPLDSSVKLAIVRTSSASNAKYNVYWSATNNSVSTKITNAFGSGSTFLHTGLANGTPYYYSFTVETPDGESRKSQAVMAVPSTEVPMTNYVLGISSPRIATPTALSATGKNQTVSLVWDMPAKSIPTIFDPASLPVSPPTYISTYTLYWSKEYIKNPTQAFKLQFTGDSKTKLPFTFDHNTDLTNNTLIYYLVGATAAVDKDGLPLKKADGTALPAFESGTSSQIAVVPVIRKPTAPSGLTVTSGSQQVSLKWNKDSSSSAYYKIYVSNTLYPNRDDLLAQGRQVTTASTSYTHTGLQSGKTYYYVVTAVDEAESSPSAMVAVALP